MGRWCGDGDNERGGLCRMANGARHGQHGRIVPSVALVVGLLLVLRRARR